MFVEASRPLVAYHTPERVLADIRHDLATPENSHLYVRRGAANQVDAFVWGSLSTAEEIALDLLPRYGALEQQRLQTNPSTPAREVQASPIHLR